MSHSSWLTAPEVTSFTLSPPPAALHEGFQLCSGISGAKPCSLPMASAPTSFHNPKL